MNKLKKMMNQIINNYKKLKSEVYDPDYTEQYSQWSIKASNENLELIKLGIQTNTISSDILENEKTKSLDEILPQNQILRIAILPKISIDLSDDYISESLGNFYGLFAKYFRIPKNLFISELYDKPGFDEQDFLNTLEYIIVIKDILDQVNDYKKSLPKFEEYFMFATKPIVLKTYLKETPKNFLDKANEVRDLISSNFKKETYKSFLKIQMENILHDINEENRFSTLLTNFETVFLNFKNSVELFFKDYDYQKNKNDLELKKVELAKKIHGVVNEIGSKVITIPLGYLLLLKELKPDQGFSFLNLTILCVSVVYAVIIETSIYNQFLFLETLSTDISEFLKTTLSTDELVQLFTRYKVELNNSCRLQTILLWIFRISLWLLPIVLLIFLITFNSNTTHNIG